jgi:Peptidase_C39 like family
VNGVECCARVPYFAQWESPELVSSIVSGRISAADDPRWRDWGTDCVDEYAFWARRTCGVACLRMVLAHRSGAAPPPAKELKDDCLAAGAYVVEGTGVRGLVYAPFVDYVGRRWDLKATVETDLGVDLMADSIRSGHLVMLSVHRDICTPEVRVTERGGHLVLVIGVWSSGLVVHDPSGVANRSQSFVRLSYAQIEMFSAARGVVFRDVNGR